MKKFKWWMLPFALLLLPLLPLLFVLAMLVLVGKAFLIDMPVCIFCWIFNLQIPDWIPKAAYAN